MRTQYRPLFPCCEHCRTPVHYTLERGGAVLHSGGPERDRFDLCVDCIEPYANLDSDYLEHAWHTLVAILQQWLEDGMDASDPETTVVLARAVARTSEDIASQAALRVAHRLGDGRNTS